LNLSGEEWNEKQKSDHYQLVDLSDLFFTRFCVE
jgi:hypothetical protein